MRGGCRPYRSIRKPGRNGDTMNSRMDRSIAGYRGDKNYTLDGVYDDICRRVRARGLYLGAAMGPTKEDAEKIKGKGVQWTVFGQDARALSGALKANFDAVKEF